MRNRYFKLGVILFLVCLATTSIKVKAQEVDDAGGSKIGSIGSDGEVDDAGGSKIGSFSSSGEVDDAGGSKIGSVQNVGKKWAGAAYFFFFFHGN